MVFGLFKKKNKEEKENTEKIIDFENSKYPEQTCALCNQKGTDKKWGGQYWHKKCLRSTKGMAKGMI